MRNKFCFLSNFYITKTALENKLVHEKDYLLEITWLYFL